MRASRIDIATIKGPRSIHAYPSSHPELWVHRAPGEQRRKLGWSITHKPTGMGIPKTFPSRAKALKFVDHIKHLDWNFRSPSSKKIRQMSREMRELLAEKE